CSSPPWWPDETSRRARAAEVRRRRRWPPRTRTSPVRRPSAGRAPTRAPRTRARATRGAARPPRRRTPPVCRPRNARAQRLAAPRVDLPAGPAPMGARRLSNRRQSPRFAARSLCRASDRAAHQLRRARKRIREARSIGNTRLRHVRLSPPPPPARRCRHVLDQFAGAHAARAQIIRHDDEQRVLPILEACAEHADSAAELLAHRVAEGLELFDVPGAYETGDEPRPLPPIDSARCNSVCN